MIVRVRGFVGTHRLVRADRANKSVDYAEVQQIGGRNHGRRRVVDAHRLRIIGGGGGKGRAIARVDKTDRRSNFLRRWLARLGG